MTYDMSYNFCVCLKFRTEKKLNVGGAYAVKSRSDVPFQRITVNGESYFYIPGSTIKGVLRTALIKVAGLLGYGNIPWTVDPGILTTSRDNIVSRIFGSPHDGRSKVYVEPAYITSDSKVITHIAIDDKSGICREGALYTVEYLPIGVEFKTKVYARGLDLDEARALFTAISELRFERIGKAGILDVMIVMRESRIPDELLKDDVIKLIVEVIGE